MASDKELLTARIVFRAVFPIIKVMIADDPKRAKQFEGLTGIVQFTARDEAGPVGAHLKWTDGEFEVVQEIAENPDITFSFSSVAKMVGFFAGKPMVKVFGLLWGLKILMPESKPKTPELAKLKVKLTLYMVSTGLSQLNKGGDPDMVKWTSKQPDRIYQWSVEGEDIACYLRIKAGKSKAGRGRYTRKKPFVHMIFSSIDGALPILTNQIDIVQAMKQGLVSNEGSPEYGAKIGDFMLKIGAMLS
jgi:hypothetical protein